MRCQAQPSGGKACEVAQTIALKPQAGQKGPQLIAEVVFGKLSKDQPMYLVVQLPLGAWLPAGVSLSADKLTPIHAIFTRCVQTCMAESALTAANIGSLKGHNGAGRLELQDGGQHPVALPLSFKGLNQALAARDKALS